MLKGMSKFGPGGLHLIFDPKDPYTPRRVSLGEASATFGCALDTGEVECERGERPLTKEQLRWLQNYETAADDFITAVRREK